ncbi:MAG: hypothetical protein GY822_28795 [Deltaproteobacteria bacterium]|nr:hypothetical protein [Deltaproteobacteria bacterium]
MTPPSWIRKYDIRRFSRIQPFIDELSRCVDVAFYSQPFFGVVYEPSSFAPKETFDVDNAPSKQSPSTQRTRLVVLLSNSRWHMFQGPSAPRSMQLMPSRTVVGLPCHDALCIEQSLRLHGDLLHSFLNRSLRFRLYRRCALIFQPLTWVLAVVMTSSVLGTEPEPSVAVVPQVELASTFQAPSDKSATSLSKSSSRSNGDPTTSLPANPAGSRLFQSSSNGQRVGPMLFSSSFRAQTAVDSNPWWQENAAGGFSDAAPHLRLKVSPTASATFSPWKGLDIGTQFRSSFSSNVGTLSSKPANVLVEPLFFEGQAGAGIRYLAEHWFQFRLLGQLGTNANANHSWALNNGLQFPLLDAALVDKGTQKQLNASFLTSVKFDFLLLLEIQYEARMLSLEQHSHFFPEDPAQWWLLSWDFSSSSNAEIDALDSLEQSGHHLTARVGLGMFRLDEAGPFHLFAAGETRLGKFRSDGFFAAGFLGVDARIRPWSIDVRIGMDDESTLLTSATLRCERTTSCIDAGLFRDVVFFENDLLSHHASIRSFFERGPLLLDLSIDAGVAQSLHNTGSTWDSPHLHSALQMRAGSSIGPMSYRIGARFRSFHSTDNIAVGRIQALLFFEAELGKSRSLFLPTAQFDGRKNVVP